MHIQCKRSMNILYVDRLSLFSLYCILTRRITYSDIYYLDINHGTKHVVALLERIGILRGTPIEIKFCLGDLRDENGGSLYIKIYNDIASISKKIRERELAKNRLVQEFGKYFDLNKFMIYFEYPIGEELRETAVLFHAALCHKRDNFEENTNFVIFFKKGLFYKYLLEYADLLNIKTIYYSVIIDLPFKKYFYLIKKKIKNIFIPKCNNKKKKNYKIPAKKGIGGNIIPVIAATYLAKPVVFNLKKRSDFSWFLTSDIPRGNILIYFEDHRPVTKEMADKMKEVGIKFISLSGKFTYSEKVPIWSSSEIAKKERNFLLATLFKTYFKNLIRMQFIKPFYIINMVFFILRYSYWYDFFKRNNVKINVNCSIFTKESCPMNLALEKNGGVNIAIQYSNFFFTDYGHRIFSDVLFLFGPDYRWIAKESDSIINNIIYCGYITDYSFNRVKEDAQRLRKQLLSRGVEFIICFFDESSSDDKMSAVPNSRSSYIYRHLIELILSDRTLGLICSPKKTDSLFKRIPEVKELVNKAKETERVIFMGGSHHTDNYPTEVAQAADLCIGILLGGTTVLEANLSGTPSVFLDLEKLYSLNIYQWGRGKVVFDNIDELFKTIQEYRKSPDSVPGFGDLELWIKKKDPFKDGNASLRIGQYINWLFENLKRDEDKKKAIKYANENYAKLWGIENIVQ